MPEIIEQGYLYIAQPPLYGITRGKSRVYRKDDRELEELLIEQGVEGATYTQADGAQIAAADLADKVRTGGPGEAR